MKEREALKMALEAFEWNYNTDLDNIPACEQWAKMLKANITAIKEALAHCPDCGKAVGDAGHIHTCSPQPEQEPVVWMYQDKISHAVKFQKHMSDFVDHSRWYETPLYTKEQL